MTPTEVYNLIRNQCAESSTNFWSEAEVYDYMVNGETIIAQLIPCTEATDTSITTVASTREYSLPSGVMSMIRVEWNDVKQKMIDINELINVEGEAYGGVTVEGNPEYYYLFNDKIGFSPIPDAAQTVKLWYMKEPATLSSSSTAFTIPDRYGHYIADYALYRMYLKDQEMESQAASFKTLWDQNLAKIERQWRRYKYRDRFAVPSVQSGIFVK